MADLKPMKSGGHGAYNNDSLNDFLNNNEVKTSNFFATLGFASLGCFFIVALYLATAIILLHDKNKNGYSLSTPWNKTELCLMNTSLNLNSGAQPTEDIYFDSQASSNCDLNNIVTNYSKYHKERENLSITVTGYSTDEPTKSTFNLPSKEKSSEYSRFISNSLIKNNIEVTSELLADKDVRKVVNHVAKFMSLDTALRIITEKRENVNNTVDDYMQLNFLNTYSKPNPIKNDFYSLNKFCNKLKNELALNIICNYNDATFTISKENVRNVKIFFIESANKKLNKVLATKRAYMVANEFEDKYGVNIQDTNKFKIKGKASSCFGNDTKNKRTLSINKKNIIGCRQVEVTLHDYLTYTDALYFAAYTMTTTGYGDFQPNTNFIKMFTIYMNLHEFLFIALVISIFSTSVRSNRA